MNEYLVKVSKDGTITWYTMEGKAIRSYRPSDGYLRIFGGKL